MALLLHCWIHFYRIQWNKQDLYHNITQHRRLNIQAISFRLFLCCCCNISVLYHIEKQILRTHTVFHKVLELQLDKIVTSTFEIIDSSFFAVYFAFWSLNDFCVKRIKYFVIEGKITKGRVIYENYMHYTPFSDVALVYVILRQKYNLINCNSSFEVKLWYSILTFWQRQAYI